MKQLFAEYARHGWRLCAIEPGTKSPTYAGWNTRPITDPDTAAALDGVGLLHALSGTCALDIDIYEQSKRWLAERGVDLDALLADPASVKISSGRPGRYKLLYSMRAPLRTLKPQGSGLELRCATNDGNSVQDVLPDTIHPDTKKPYVWVYGDEMIGDWHHVPPIPAPLLQLWRNEIGASAAVKASTERAAATPQHDELRALIANRDPSCGYDEWLKIGMALHDATSGSAAGLQIWDEWSRTGKSYKGIADLKTHWLSFRSVPGRHVVTVNSLRAERTATVDDFANVGKMETPKPKDAKKDAILELEKRLVYVRSIERYFDTTEARVVNTESGLQNLFMSALPGKLDPIKLLKLSRTKRVVTGLGFHPGAGAIFKDGTDQYANLYRNRLPAPIEPTPRELELFQWLMNRIPDDLFRRWLLAFLAHAVQKPGVKIKSAPLLWSETTGNGKTTILRTIPALLVGREFSREVGYGLLESSFNDFLLGAWHINLTEFRAGSRADRMAIAAKLKPWITDDVIAVHPKGLAAYTIPNHLFVTATSNEPDAAPIDVNDRRWAVCEFTAPQMTDAETTELHEEFLDTERAAGVLRHIFLHHPIGGFNPNAAAPITQSRTDMIEASLGAEEELLRTAFETREGPFVRDAVEMTDIQQFIKSKLGFMPNGQKLGRVVSRYPFYGKLKRTKVSGRDYRMWIFHNHSKWLAVSPIELLKHARGEDVELIA